MRSAVIEHLKTVTCGSQKFDHISKYVHFSILCPYLFSSIMVQSSIDIHGVAEK